MNLTIRGRIPSKKNSRNIFARDGKIVNIPNKKYKEWHDSASGQLIGLTPSKLLNSEDIDGVVLYFYAPDKRAADLTNKAESIMDLLVDNKVIVDDNWFIVGDIHLKFMGVDRKDPRCEITLNILSQK